MNKILLILLILLMTLLGSFGGFFFKKCTSTKGSIWNIIKNKYLYLGILLYLLGAVINIYVLKFMPLTVVLPLSSITYIWTMFSSALILKEKITYKKVIGITFIIIGAVFISLY